MPTSRLDPASGFHRFEFPPVLERNIRSRHRIRHDRLTRAEAVLLCYLRQIHSLPNRAKVAVIGDTSVGKTNILLRYCDNDFKHNYAATIGIDFKNPLNEKCEFLVTFDNPNFSLASKLPGPLEPGKATNLQIKYDAKPDLPTTGRMIITTKNLPPWIYYLQGE